MRQSTQVCSMQMIDAEQCICVRHELTCGKNIEKSDEEIKAIVRVLDDFVNIERRTEWVKLMDQINTLTEKMNKEDP